MLRTGQVLMQVEIQTEEQEQSEYFSTISPPPLTSSEGTDKNYAK